MVPPPKEQVGRNGSTFRGNETFSTEENGVMAYNKYMPNVDDKTTIIKDNSHKSIDNFAVKVLREGFELWLFHATKVKGDHVDEAELVGKWYFKDIISLDKQVELLKDSVKGHQHL